MRTFKKTIVSSVNKLEITKVCIDDFALKKGKRYGTVMIDIDSRRIIDMIESREYEDVKAWLETYPNIMIVSRDGSLAYKRSITDALPEAHQISDRFHLIKNLTDYAAEFIKRKLRNKVQIPSDDKMPKSEPRESKNSKVNENRKLTLKDKYDFMKQLVNQGLSKTEICREINMDIRTYNKLVNASACDLEMMLTKNTDLTHKSKVKNKMKLVQEVCKYRELGLSYRG